MLAPSLIGGVIGGILSILVPYVLGASSGWSDTVRGWAGNIRLAYVRTAGAAVFGVAMPTAIALSQSGNPHHEVTYVVWYGLAVLGLVVVIWATVLIDRRAAAKPSDGDGVTQEAPAPDDAGEFAVDIQPLGDLTVGNEVVFEIRFKNTAQGDLRNVAINVDFPRSFGVRRSEQDGQERLGGSVIDSGDRRFWAGVLGPFRGFGTTTVEHYAVVPDQPGDFDLIVKVQLHGDAWKAMSWSFYVDTAGDATTSAPPPTQAVEGVAHQLTDFYAEGEEHRVKCLPPDGLPPIRQILWNGGDPQTAKSWDAAVSGYLLERSQLKVYYPGWKAAGDPPTGPPVFKQAHEGPPTLEAWYRAKLEALASIIEKVS